METGFEVIYHRTAADVGYPNYVAELDEPVIEVLLRGDRDRGIVMPSCPIGGGQVHRLSWQGLAPSKHCKIRHVALPQGINSTDA